MINQCYRQRRRILVSAALFTLSAGIGAIRSDVPMSHLPIWVAPVTALLFFTAATLVVGALILLAPTMRTLCEVLALFTLAEALVIHVAPGLDASLADRSLRLAIGAAVVALIYLALYGRLLDGIPARFSVGLRHEVAIRATPEAVWRAVIPDQTDAADRQKGPAHAEQAVLDAPRPCAPRPPGGAVTFVTRQRPVHCRFLFAPDRAGATATDTTGCATGGIYDFRIIRRTSDVLLQISLYRTGIRLRETLRIWFDDALGCEADALKARLESRSTHDRDSPRRTRSGDLV